MVELAHAYLVDFLSHKREELAPQLFDEAVVHKDVVRPQPPPMSLSVCNRDQRAGARYLLRLCCASLRCCVQQCIW